MTARGLITGQTNIKTLAAERREDERLETQIMIAEIADHLDKD